MEGENSNQRLQQAQAQVGEVVDIMRVNVEKVNTKNLKLSGHKWLRGQNSSDSGSLSFSLRNLPDRNCPGLGSAFLS